MRFYEYLIGGKKTGQIDDLKDAMPDNKSFRDLKEGETFFVSQFKPNGTCVYTEEIKISSIRKESTYWVFTGLTKKGVKCVRLMVTKDLDKILFVRDQLTHYKVYSTFEMDGEPFFKLAKKEIENSKE